MHVASTPTRTPIRLDAAAVAAVVPHMFGSGTGEEEVFNRRLCRPTESLRSSTRETGRSM